MRKSPGFTLIEVMIVVAIVGLLVAIAYPSYQKQIQQSHRTDGQAALLDISARQERFFAQNNTYTVDIAGVAGLNRGDTLSADDHYNLSVVACAGGTIASCYTLSATATGTQAKDTDCATFTFDHLGVKTAKKSDNSINTGCWR